MYYDRSRVRRVSRERRGRGAPARVWKKKPKKEKSATKKLKSGVFSRLSDLAGLSPGYRSITASEVRARRARRGFTPQAVRTMVVRILSIGPSILYDTSIVSDTVSDTRISIGIGPRRTPKPNEHPDRAHAWRVRCELCADRRPVPSQTHPGVAASSHTRRPQPPTPQPLHSREHSRA